MNLEHRSHRLLQNGLALFILGLASGLAMLAAPAAFKNPRLALSSHLIGVMGGMFLAVAGLLFNRLRLPPRLLTVSFWLAVYGAYANWCGTILGAVFGTRIFTAIAGQGHVGAAWQEMLVGGALVTSGIATIAACALFLWGLEPRE